MNAIRKGKQVSGYIHALAEVLAANGGMIFGLIILFLIGSSSQVQDSAVLAAEYPQLMWWIPIATLCSLFFVASKLAAERLRLRAEQIAEEFYLQSSQLMFFAKLVVPYSLVAHTLLFAGYVAPQLWTMTSTGVMVSLFFLTALLEVHYSHRGVFPRYRTLLLVVLTACCIVLIGVSLSVEVNRRIGSVGILIFAVGVWAAGLNTVYLWIQYTLRLPGIFIMVTAIVIILLLPGSPGVVPSDSRERIHRRIPNATSHLRDWLLARYESDPGHPIPVFMVAAEGGGIRAAYWAARRLAILNEDVHGALVKNIFAYSGVSGGALGIATFHDSATNPGFAPYRVADVLDEFYAQDFLSPVLGRLMFVEPWRPLLRPWLDDVRRDTTFEQQLAKDWKRITASESFSMPFLRALSRPGIRVPPVMVFNTTRAESGLRVILSNVEFGERFSMRRKNLFAMKYPWGNVDLSLVESIHLSARFPIISPPADIRLPFHERFGVLKSQKDGETEYVYPSGCDLYSSPDDSRCGRWGIRRWGTLVDGGYIDNSGVASLRELYTEIARARAQAEPNEIVNNEEKLFRQLIRRVSLHILLMTTSHPASEAEIFTDPVELFMSDTEAMLRTMLQARAARAGTEVELLLEEIRSQTRGLEKYCGVWQHYASKALHQIPSMKTLKRAGRNCERFGDSFSNIQMQLHHLKPLPDLRPGLKRMLGVCGEVENLVEPPLGWSLSVNTRNVIRCSTEVARLPGYGELRNYAEYWASSETSLD